MHGDQGVDFFQQTGVNMTEVFAEGFVVETALVFQPGQRGADAHDLAYQSVVVGGVFELIKIAPSGHAHHAEHQDVPEVHAGAAGLLLVANDSFFEQAENRFVEFGGLVNPLESSEHGGHFVAAAGREADLLNRGLTELELGVESFAHPRTWTRMFRPETLILLDFRCF